MIIGHFQYDSGQDLYTGAIRTLAFSHDHLVLRPIAKSSAREPDYRVLQIWDAGEVEFGAAWLRRSDRGQTYLSVHLDGPTLPHALNLALFPDDRGEDATLVWNRPQRQQAPTPQAAAKAVTGAADGPRQPPASHRKPVQRRPVHG